MPHNLPPRTDAARILLVDRALGRAAEFGEALSDGIGTASITLVPSGRPAAESLRADRFDLLLIDIASLGDLDGHAEIAVARLVKLAEGALALALTDAGSVSAVVEVMRAGAHDCLARPFDIPTLSARLGELARRHGKARILELVSRRAAPPQPQMPAPRPAGRGDTGEPDAVLPMWQQEQRIIEDAIARFAGNVALAAAALELSPSTIYRKRQLWAEQESRRGAA